MTIVETDKLEETPKVLTRVYVTADGNIIVTDLWREIRDILCAKGDFRDSSSDL